MLLLIFTNAVVDAARCRCEVLGNGQEVGQKDVCMRPSLVWVSAVSVSLC